MSATKIEWADATINPIVGCSKCSPGCDNCYAERMAMRLAKNPLTAQKYAGVVDGDGWTGKTHYSTTNAHRHDEPHRVPGKNKRVFIGSMTDMFHPNVEQDALDEIFASILADTIFTNGHGHKFIMVTKRVDRMLEYFAPGPDVLLRRWCGAGDGWIHTDDPDISFSDYAEGQTIPEPAHERYPNLLHEYLWPLPNFWALSTICNQQEADEKIPLLLRVPAAKRGVSVEPMLGPVDLDKNEALHPWRSQIYNGPTLDWVICGGESGRGARPMHPDWVRGLRAQCEAADVPFFFKGWGEWYPRSMALEGLPPHTSLAAIDPDCKEWPCVRLTQSGGNGWNLADVDGGEDIYMQRIGKKRAGRLLDGREWNEVPI